MNAHHTTSITARITLFTGVVAALMSTVLAVVLMIAIHSFATDTLTRETRAAGGRVATRLEEEVWPSPPLSGLHSRNIQIVDHKGRVVASTPALHGKPPMAQLAPDPLNSKEAVVCDGIFPDSDCAIVVAQSAHRPEGNWTVYTSSPAIPLWVEPWLAALVAGSAVGIAVGITYLGHRIVTTALRPVSAIRKELDEINASCPGHRVPVPSSRDEISGLADSINLTLARLDRAMKQQRQFTSDASHDLRSPIAAMRAEVEDALQAPRDTSVTTMGKSILGSLDRLEAIVSNLLALAKLDAGAPYTDEPIDLAELTNTECQTRRPTSKRLICRLESGVLVRGDRLQLTRLITNLLDNADRHADSTVTVTVRQAAQDVAELEVVDDGPGIDPDKRELVFERFTRLDAARNKDAGGTGLGLPIARQIAESFGGTLRIEDSDRGARFVLRIPQMTT
ncbi:sensor histidine kinase [Nonomuraea purpurea]|uniref:histidine kinase n=1 Tax=Nonomuraea purpurea TaxID=1849276 RepID=A0ABV8GQT8_9ACTN